MARKVLTLESNNGEMTRKLSTLEASAGARNIGVEDIKLLEELHSHVELLKVQVSQLSNRKTQLVKEIKTKEDKLSETVSRISELGNMC
jgi:hypothetical protein